MKFSIELVQKNKRLIIYTCDNEKSFSQRSNNEIPSTVLMKTATVRAKENTRAAFVHKVISQGYEPNPQSYRILEGIGRPKS